LNTIFESPLRSRRLLLQLRVLLYFCLLAVACFGHARSDDAANTASEAANAASTIPPQFTDLGRITTNTRPRSVAIAPNGRFVAVGSEEASTLDIYELGSLDLVGRIFSQGGVVLKSVFTGDGHFIYSIIAGTGFDPARLVKVETASMTIVGEGSLVPNYFPTGAVLSEREDLLYLGNLNGGIDKIDTRTLTVSRTLAIGIGSVGLDLVADRQWLFAVQPRHGLVTVVDLREFAFEGLGTIGSPTVFPVGVAADVANGALYILDGAAGEVTADDQLGKTLFARPSLRLTQFSITEVLSSIWQDRDQPYFSKHFSKYPIDRLIEAGMHLDHQTHELAYWSRASAELTIASIVGLMKMDVVQTIALPPDATSLSITPSHSSLVFASPEQHSIYIYGRGSRNQ
jgi:hypothetical protein